MPRETRSPLADLLGIFEPLTWPAQAVYSGIRGIREGISGGQSPLQAIGSNFPAMLGGLAGGGLYASGVGAPLAALVGGGSAGILNRLGVEINPNQFDTQTISEAVGSDLGGGTDFLAELLMNPIGWPGLAGLARLGGRGLGQLGQPLSELPFAKPIPTGKLSIPTGKFVSASPRLSRSQLLEALTPSAQAAEELPEGVSSLLASMKPRRPGTDLPLMMEQLQPQRGAGLNTVPGGRIDQPSLLKLLEQGMADDAARAAEDAVSGTATRAWRGLTRDVPYTMGPGSAPAGNVSQESSALSQLLEEMGLATSPAKRRPPGLSLPSAQSASGYSEQSLPGFMQTMAKEASEAKAAAQTAKMMNMEQAGRVPSGLPRLEGGKLVADMPKPPGASQAAKDYLRAQFESRKATRAISEMERAKPGVKFSTSHMTEEEVAALQEKLKKIREFTQPPKPGIQRPKGLEPLLSTHGKAMVPTEMAKEIGAVKTPEQAATMAKKIIDQANNPGSIVALSGEAWRPLELAEKAAKQGLKGKALQKVVDDFRNLRLRFASELEAGLHAKFGQRMKQSELLEFLDDIHRNLSGAIERPRSIAGVGERPIKRKPGVKKP